MERPDSIVVFERIAYLALALSITSAIVNTWPAALTSGTLMTIEILTFLFQILFIWLIARRHKNWARWTWIVVQVFGTLIAIADEFRHPLPLKGTAGIVVVFLLYIASLTSAYFLLTRDAFAWFRGQTADLNAFD